MSSSPIVWMNGALMPADEVRVSPFDLGLAVGWGAFETMPGYDGQVFGFARHFERLQHSAGVMDIHVPPQEVIETAVSEVLNASGLEAGRSRIRVSLSGGEYSLFGGEDAKDARGNVMVNAVRIAEPKDQVVLMASPYPHNERSGLSGCKTSSYGNNLMALRHAVEAGADEAVMVNTVGQLCECATSNVFLVNNGEISTPSLKSGCLAGVTRAMVIELAHEDGLAVEECDLTMIELNGADEIFLTSSTREVQSAVMMNTETHSEGEVTRRISELYQHRVMKELGL